MALIRAQTMALEMAVAVVQVTAQAMAMAMVADRVMSTAADMAMAVPATNSEVHLLKYIE